LPRPIKYPQQVAPPLLRLLVSLTSCLGKNSITTRSKIRQAKNSRI
jgi:hypothetical protein